MSHWWDPEVLEALAALPAASEIPPVDWRELRQVVDEEAKTLAASFDPASSVVRRLVTLGGGNEAVDGCWFEPQAGLAPREGPRPAVLYLHGGGLVANSVAHYDRVVAGYVASTGIPMLAVDYRLAPESPFPVPLDDCWTALKWLIDNCDELGLDAEQISVMGDSAGGGLAAALCIRARAGSVIVRRQILIQPMLDDRTTTTPDDLAGEDLTWPAQAAAIAWASYLPDALPQGYPLAWAAPARAEDLKGLPPAWMEVGQLDLFRDETLDYARRLCTSQVPVDCHVIPGVPHGFEWFAASAQVARRAMDRRVHALRSLWGQPVSKHAPPSAR